MKIFLSYKFLLLAALAVGPVAFGTQPPPPPKHSACAALFGGPRAFRAAKWLIGISAVLFTASGVKLYVDRARPPKHDYSDVVPVPTRQHPRLGAPVFAEGNWVSPWPVSWPRGERGAAGSPIVEAENFLRSRPDWDVVVRSFPDRTVRIVLADQCVASGLPAALGEFSEVDPLVRFVPPRSSGAWMAEAWHARPVLVIDRNASVTEFLAAYAEAVFDREVYAQHMDLPAFTGASPGTTVHPYYWAERVVQNVAAEAHLNQVGLVEHEKAWNRSEESQRNFVQAKTRSEIVTMQLEVWAKVDRARAHALAVDFASRRVSEGFFPVTPEEELGLAARKLRAALSLSVEISAADKLFTKTVGNSPPDSLDEDRFAQVTLMRVQLEADKALARRMWDEARESFRRFNVAPPQGQFVGL